MGRTKGRNLFLGFSLAAIILVGVAGLASASSPPLSQSPFAAPTPEPEGDASPGEAHESGGMYAPEARLARPPMSDPPTQIELGHYQYWMSCMICHGDRGQGLTEEWRGVLDPEDQNCWQSKCHAPNHPPEGFEIPRSSPAVMGEGALVSFKTAADLHAYIRTDMPWAFPGLFDDREYWRITAYLAQANQIDLGVEPLGPHNGNRLVWIPKLPQNYQPAIGYERMVGGAVFLLLVGAAVLQRWSQAGGKGKLDRRRFLKGLGRGLMVAAAVLVVDLVSRLLSFQAAGEDAAVVPLGQSGDYARGGLAYVEAARVYVGRDEQGLYALDAVCPHLGCLVERDKQGRFKCPCHGSVFDVEGQARTGPATQPLRYLYLWLDQDGQLKVDRAKPVASTARLSSEALSD